MLKHAEGGNFTRQRTCESKSKTPFIQVIFVVKIRSQEETSPFRSGQRTEARERDSGGGGGVEARKGSSVTCDGVGDSRCRTPGVPRTPGLPGSNDRVGYRPRRCSAITSSSIPELHRRASGTKRVPTKKALHSLCTRCATLSQLLHPSFVEAFLIVPSRTPPLLGTVCTLDEAAARFCVALCHTTRAKFRFKVDT